ncbi:hypothetical protein BJ912DRAFT_971585 [Pholiota molesta]|nr:hypothetical protein BJ912DRAFT_971585 [Pholiota molesta]
MTSRWTQEQEDAYRLPEGFKRIGYDADTRRYLFRDKHGVLYHSEPEMEYGTLTPMAPTNSAIESARPSAFSPSSSGSDRSPSISPPLGPIPRTFQDILPPELITSSTLSDVNSRRLQASSKPPRDRFVEAVRRSALPKMQGVVTNLRRSVTSIRRPRAATYTSLTEEENRRLVRRESTSTTGLERSASIGTSLTDISRPYRAPENKHRPR